EQEGRQLKDDFILRLDNIEKQLEKVKGLESTVVEEYQQKLKERMENYLADVEMDEAKFLNEVAFFTDRASITEEVTRLASHIERFRSILQEKDPVGRKLDFLIQEIHREVNTIGSKANHLEISNHVVDMKSEVEKMREQIQNIE
ncbi:MAG TPA: hypothetical protein DHN33_01525, partial [Eubacteriaceae bacterium]|nr:hypothetical protein [Eubacteriaceae bacterium]